MAYLNFATLQGSPVAVPADVAAAPRTQTGFSALEWQVVAIAQHDRLSSLEKPGRLATALTMIFGGQRPNPALADSRLEALRRLAVHAWHKGYTVPRAAIRARSSAPTSNSRSSAIRTGSRRRFSGRPRCAAER